MKSFFNQKTSFLYLTLFLTNISFSQQIDKSYGVDSYVENSIQQSLERISTSSLEENSVDFFTLNLENSYLQAPNSYIFDVDFARENNYNGLKIPVNKAFEIWEHEAWFLNETLHQNGNLSAYTYWEDVHGLIDNVKVDLQNPINHSKIEIEVNPTKGKGNALISLHYGNNGNHTDPIIWSWHVWVTDDPSNGVIYDHDIETDINGTPISIQFMDRNMGAVYNQILGHEWDRTVGLFYQWGRKDPIPSFVNKDFSFYELNGLVGYMRNREGIHTGHTLPEIIRPFEDISSNIKFSINNPISYIVSDDSGTWFSQQQYRIPDNPNTNTIETITWDLWSDNRKGLESNSSDWDNPTIQNDSRSYELKSPYDPCPNGWRVPSHLGRATYNNNHSPWGRRNSGWNDDHNQANNSFTHNQTNAAIPNAKVYIGLGMDFSQATTEDRNIGIFPNTGTYVINENHSVVFQDENSEAAIWTATYSLGGARYFKLISDPLRYDVSDYGLNGIFVNQTEKSSVGHSVRCMRDPNLAYIGNFETEYTIANKTLYTKGLEDPNSFLIVDQTEIDIPLNKAFSAHQHLFPYSDLPNDQLVANVNWTDNENLIQSLTINPISSDPRDNLIHVKINEGQKGNAIISLHNGSIQNPVYWTWHIWASADEIKEITYVNQETLPSTSGHFVNPTEYGFPPLTTTFMDRNLGAIHDLPLEIIQHPNLPLLKEEVKNSGGLHFQWGRKDPIPSFQYVGNVDTYEIYKGISVDANGIVNYQPINAAQYQSNYTRAYSQYKHQAGVIQNEPKHISANKIIEYSIQNPLTYLHQNTTSNSDWISEELATEANRWGHGTKKSIYDPCPRGWRVPDVFTVFENRKGSSPWFNGQKLSSSQGNPQPLNSHYGGEYISNEYNSYGWIFDDPDYFIGNFPTTGIIGENHPTQLSGNNSEKPITGIWTAALTQQMKGYALAMKIGDISNDFHRVITTGNQSPAKGLNVRCAKDEERYNGEIRENSNELDIRDYTQTQNIDNLNFYPNPVTDYLFINVDENFSIEIYDLQGRKIHHGEFMNKKIDLSNLPKGVYLGKVQTKNHQKTIKLIKK